MPRIDPAQLLKTLGVLLGPHGGIKSPEEVNIWSESHSEVKCYHIAGWQTRPVDAEVLQETCLQSDIRKDPEVLLHRIDRAFPEREGLGAPQSVVH